MSTTMEVFESRVRALVNDTQQSNPVVVQPRMREMVTAAMHHFGERVGYATDDLTSLAITAGNGGPYTLNSSANYSTVHSLRLSSSGEFLCKYTRAQLDAIYGNDATPGIPVAWAAWENASQNIEVAVRPYPIANDTLQVFGSLVPARLTTDASVLPFSEPMLSALVKAVAADVIESATDEQLQQLHMNRAVARLFRSDAEAALVAEEIRRNRLKRTGRIEQVDV